MIVLTKGQSDNIYVTLNEKRTLDSGYYLFRFENVTTKTVVTQIYSFAEDLSNYQDRYNKFSIGDIFDEPGLWTYRVYEQESSSNTDPGGLIEVERGWMRLNPETEFSFTQYGETTTYKQYGG